jgi:hypothetical protein
VEINHQLDTVNLQNYAFTISFETL